MRVDSRINSLDDIFNHDDLGLLADVKPVTAKTDENAMVLQTFKEVESFFRRHGRLPNNDGNLDEKILDRKWQALLNNKQSIVKSSNNTIRSICWGCLKKWNTVKQKILILTR